MDATTNREDNMERYAIKCDECKTEIGRTDSLHESACGGKCDDCKPSVTVTVPIALAEPLIQMVGGERDARGRWVFPDEFLCWQTDEALRYALAFMPGVLDLA